MILGYILMCGLGPLEAVNGCRVYPRLFTRYELCEEARDLFLSNLTVKKGLYVGASGCVVIGESI